MNYTKLGRIHWFYEEIYKTNIHFVIDDDLKRAYEIYGQTFHPNKKECLCYVDKPNGLSGRLITHIEHIGAVIWLPIGYKLHDAIHEIYHFVNYVMEAHSVAPATCDNDEHYAYYIEYIFKRFLEFEDSWAKNGKYEGTGCHVSEEK